MQEHPLIKDADIIKEDKYISSWSDAFTSAKGTCNEYALKIDYDQFIIATNRKRKESKARKRFKL